MNFLAKFFNPNQEVEAEMLKEVNACHALLAKKEYDQALSILNKLLPRIKNKVVYDKVNVARKKVYEAMLSSKMNK